MLPACLSMAYRVRGRAGWFPSYTAQNCQLLCHSVGGEWSPLEAKTKAGRQNCSPWRSPLPASGISVKSLKHIKQKEWVLYKQHLCNLQEQIY